MKTLFFSILLLTALTANAQITKGNWLVGGNSSFTSTTATRENNIGDEIKVKGTGFQFNPNLGYFVANKFATGLDIGLNFSNPSGSNNSNWALGFGPFVRYYFLEAEKRVNFFGKANFLYSTGLSKINNDIKSTSFGVGSGCVVFFNSSVGLELSLNYINSTSKSDHSSDTNYNTLFMALGFQIHLEK